MRISQKGILNMLDNLSVEKQEFTNALIDYYYYSLDHRNFTDPDYIKVTEVLMKWIEEDKNVLVQFDGEEKKVIDSLVYIVQHNHERIAKGHEWSQEKCAAKATELDKAVAVAGAEIG